MANGQTEPTEGVVLTRPERVEKILSENIRKPVGEAMLEAGYSPSYSKHPQDLKKNKAWQRIMKKYLPDDELGKKHQKLLNASKIDHYVFPATTSDEDIKALIDSVEGLTFIKIQGNAQWKRCYFSVPDNDTQGRMLELAYKIKGKMGRTDSGGGTGDIVSQEIQAVIIRIRNILPESK